MPSRIFLAKDAKVPLTDLNRAIDSPCCSLTRIYILLSAIANDVGVAIARSTSCSEAPLTFHHLETAIDTAPYLLLLQLALVPEWRLPPPPLKLSLGCPPKPP